MAYSRWGSRGSGNWYTYWNCQDEETENRDTALFAVCGIHVFTAKELRDDISGCIGIVSLKDPGATRKQLHELEKYMGEFLDDVNDEYPKTQAALEK